MLAYEMVFHMPEEDSSWYLERHGLFFSLAPSPFIQRILSTAPCQYLSLCQYHQTPTGFLYNKSAFFSS